MSLKDVYKTMQLARTAVLNFDVQFNDIGFAEQVILGKFSLTGVDGVYALSGPKNLDDDIIKCLGVISDPAVAIAQLLGCHATREVYKLYKKAQQSSAA